MAARGEAGETDAALLRRFAAGDGTAFDDLVRRYLRLVGGIAYQIVGDYHAAADVAQEVFLKAYGGLENLRDPNSLKGWLYGVARSTALDWLRKNRRRPVSLTPLMAEDAVPAEGEAGPAAVAEREELRRHVLEAIDEMPESYREILVLKYLDERSYKEIGEILGISVQTIESRLFRARNAIRSKFRSYDPKHTG